MEDESVKAVDDLASCADCFAVVKRGDEERHFEWHDRVIRDAVAAALVVVEQTAIEPIHGE